MKTRSLSHFVLTALVVSCSTLIVPAQAENLDSLRFLENYAVRLYTRGEVTLAQKEFERIARLDPQNVIANNYLKNNPPAVTTTPPSSLSGLMQDIAGLRTDILTYEKDANELERTIRLMMGENDNLYTALRKRSRDLAELRAQMKGTPYANEYAELMKTLPPDRVPQRLLNTRDILPSVSRRALVTRDEVEALAREIADREQEITLLNARATHPGQMEELAETLKEKRALLVEKNLALIEKTASLAQLKDDVTNMNSVLKDADHRYGVTLTELEALTRKIHTEIANKDDQDQKRYRELLSDYAARIQEIELLKQDIQTRTASLAEQKPTLEKQEAIITRIDTAVQDNSQELEKYKQLLKECKDALAAKDAMIAEQEKDLVKKEATIAQKNTALAEQSAVIAIQDQDITDKATLITQKDAAISEKSAVIVQQFDQLSMSDVQLNSVGEKIGTIEELLAGNDNAILALKDGIARMKEITRAKTDQEIANAKELADKVRRLETTLTKLETVPLKASTDEQDLSASLRRSEDALLAAEKDLAQKNTEVRTLAEKLSATETTIAHLKDKLSSYQNAKPQEPQQPVASVKELPVPSSDTPALHELLASRDQEIVALNTRLLQKDEETRQLAAMISAYKESALKADALAREQSTRAAEKMMQSNKAAIDSRGSLQNYELTIKEKDNLITTLQNDLSDRTTSLKSAATQAALLEEKLSALSLKQDAIRAVITKRDATIATLEQEINALKKQLKQEKK